MDLGIAGKRALVTGASAGIGQAVAHVLAAEGARVVIAARNLEKLTLVRDEIASTGADAPAMVTGDLSTAEGVAAVAQAAAAEHGGIDILVNNAGASRPMPKDADDSFWEEAFALNFSSARRMTEALLPGMREARWGRVVKVALVSWSRSLAQEIAADGVTVNCVAPGRINSDQILNRLFPTEESRAGQIKDNPMGRFGEPQELADLVAFLVSDRARYITGVHVPVDGGMVRLSVT